MKFTHNNPYKIDKLKRKTVDGKRYYVTPDGKKYPSVTTVSSIYAKEGIKKWRKRVGEEEANKITTQAAVRGTAVHKICEDYINNDENYLEKQMPANIQAFNNIKPVIDESIDNVVMQECPLYSDYLMVAGTVDCIAEWNGKLSIIDFKTSRKPKKKEWIENYFMQTAAYAVMFEERTKVPVSQLVILITVDDEDPQVFIEKRDDWIWKFVFAREEYRKKYNV
jgi:genome maintenance exonuclease 1